MGLFQISKHGLQSLPSEACLGREAPKNLGNSFLAFPKNHKFLKDAIAEFANTFRGERTQFWVRALVHF